MCSHKAFRTFKNEKGIYLVLGTSLILALAILAAALVGLGFISTSRARFQRISNLVALSSLEKYSSTSQVCPAGSPCRDATYQERADAALDRANQIFAANHLPGFSGTFGSIDATSSGGQGGKLTLGNWYKWDGVNFNCPASAPSNNRADYPCFVPNSAPGPTNAVKVDLKNANNNPLVYPLCNMLGACDSDVRSSAIATLVQRCTVFMLDISVSTYFGTHSSKGVSMIDSNDDPAVYSQLVSQGCPLFRGVCAATGSASLGYTRAYPSYPIYRRNVIQEGTPCTGLTSNDPFERLLWCNSKGARRGLTPYTNKEHYQDDYRNVRVDAGGGVPLDLKVDSFVDPGDPSTYWGPQPFGYFFLAFNAGLRYLNQVKSASDKAAIFAFTDKIRARYPLKPPVPPPGWQGLSTNFGMMVQLTNISNRGTTTWDNDANLIPDPVDPERRPNFLDYGFYYIAGAGGQTNLILAFNEALQLLNNECSESSQKTIVVATDGLGSCNLTSAAYASNPDDTSGNPALWECSNYSNEVKQEEQLADISNPHSVLSRLIASDVQVVSLLAGDYLNPNFYNRYNSQNEPMDPTEAYARGYSGYNPGAVGLPPLFDLTPHCPGAGSCTNQDAFDHYSIPGYSISTPLAVFGDLALKTGGAFTALMPLCDNAACNAGQYRSDPSNPGGPCKLDDAYRPDGSLQSCSVYQRNEGEQAVDAVAKVLGGSPYVLVAEEKAQ